MDSEMLCPDCAEVMAKVREDYYRCQCGTRVKQISFDDETENEQK